MTRIPTLTALITATSILAGAGVAQAEDTFNAVRTVACPSQAQLKAKTKTCTTDTRRPGPANESPTNVRSESLFDPWRIERGVFGVITMNGVMERN